MVYNLDQVINRRHTGSMKWEKYGENVLPLWIADMDFPVAEPIIEAIQQRLKHRILGYSMLTTELVQVLVERLERLYGWRVSPDSLVPLPTSAAGFTLACQVVASPGDRVLTQTPLYPPILQAPGLNGLACDHAELLQQPDGHYEIDFAAFEAAITDRTRLFILCNPHNPTGRVFRRDELERMAEICLRHGITICSDEVHCDLVFSGHRHLPIASLDPEVARHTITLMATGKTFNVAGLQFAVGIVPDPELRARMLAANDGLMHGVNALASVAALAAFREGQPWLDEVLHYLEVNRDLLWHYVQESLPGVTMGKPEGTYLAWLDCRRAGIPDSPADFFLREARVALNDGIPYGPGGEGFVRLNFACPRLTLVRALERMRKALLCLWEHEYAEALEQVV